MNDDVKKYLKEYKELMDFMGNYIHWEDENFLYRAADDFLVKKLGTSPLLVFSYSKKLMRIQDKDVLYSFRNHFHRDFRKLGYRNADLMEFLAYVDDEDLKDTGMIHYVVNGTEYFAFYFGENEFQVFVGIFKLSSIQTININLFQYFINFMSNAFFSINKWKQLIYENSLVHIDDVTGLYNQRRLNIDLDNNIDKYNQSGAPFAVLFIDIDHFKNVNDGHGHLVGTQILTELANILRQVLRGTDNIYRYGGDEFVILVPGANTQNAQGIGERILKTVKGRVFKIKDSADRFKLTVSIGIASIPENAKSRNDVLAMADRMMYHAKAAGRGQVCLADELFKKDSKV